MVKQYVAPNKWQLVGLSYGRAAARIIIRLIRRANRAFLSVQPSTIYA